MPVPRDNALKLAIRRRQSVVIVDVDGRITAESAAERQLVRVVRRLLDEAERQILLNLEGVPQIDSTGLSQLVEAYTTTTRQGGQLKLLHVTRHVDELLRVTHLGRIFEVLDVEAEALASFSRYTP